MPPVLVAVVLSKVVAIATFPLAPGWAVAVFFAPDLYLAYHLFAPAAQGLVRVLTRFETSRREIWLTIDDGPNPRDTRQILDLLDRYQARATFFVVGERVAHHPGLVEEILRRGHTVGHHTHTHPTRTFWCAPSSRVRAEVDQALAVLQAAGANPQWFRPPVGIKNPFLRQTLRKHGLICVGWSIRSYDSVNPDPTDVVAKVMRQIVPGAIVLMHEGLGVHPQTGTAAIAQLLARLQEENYRCVLPQLGQLR